MQTKIVSADLSVDKSLQAWFFAFRGQSRLSNSEIIREALNYYRASTGPQFVLLKREVQTLRDRVWKLDRGAK